MSPLVFFVPVSQPGNPKLRGPEITCGKRLSAISLPETISRIFPGIIPGIRENKETDVSYFLRRQRQTSPE
jgi:hypothetical protein